MLWCNSWAINQSSGYGLLLRRLVSACRRWTAEPFPFDQALLRQHLVDSQYIHFRCSLIRRLLAASRQQLAQLAIVRLAACARVLHSSAFQPRQAFHSGGSVLYSPYKLIDMHDWARVATVEAHRLPSSPLYLYLYSTVPVQQ